MGNITLLEFFIHADFYLLAVMEHQDPRQLHPGTQGMCHLSSNSEFLTPSTSASSREHLWAHGSPNITFSRSGPALFSLGSGM